VHATLIAGATGHVRSKFTPADTIETVRATHASVLLGVPTMYQALLTAVIGAGGPPPEATMGRPNASMRNAAPPPGPGGIPRRAGGFPRGAGGIPPGAPGRMGVPDGRPVLSGLRLAVCGSAPLSPALAERLPAVLGRLPLVRYGTTETGLNVSNIYGEQYGGTIGVPLPGVMARIWSGGEELAAGRDGEIQLRGPQVFSGYWNDPVATAAAFTPDGWFRTGDIGRVNPADGQLAIRGRIKEMIITGGLNVYPYEVETVLESHPSVAEAAVAGVPHERWGEQVTAWVVTRPGCEFDEHGLIAHARAALAAYKCPKQVFELEALPRNHVGKVIRGALIPR
jgi:malonyl-CoA/methylmalonyl-CoA synthetase